MQRTCPGRWLVHPGGLGCSPRRPYLASAQGLLWARVHSALGHLACAQDCASALTYSYLDDRLVICDSWDYGQNTFFNVQTITGMLTSKWTVRFIFMECLPT